MATLKSKFFGNIERELLEELAESGLKHTKLTVSDLSDAVVDNSRRDRPRMTTMQKEALETYRTSQTAYQLVPGNPEDFQVLENHFQFFDLRFFNGLLSSRVRERSWDFSWDGKASARACTHKRYRKEEQGNWTPSCWIQIRRRPDIQSQQQRLESYLDCMLHEMLHAFLWLFSHRKNLVYRHKGVRLDSGHYTTREDGYTLNVSFPLGPEFEAEYGITGHGSCFLKAAFALEQAASRLTHPRDLGRWISLELEVCTAMKEAGTMDADTPDRIWHWGKSHESVVGITQAQLFSIGMRISDLMGYIFCQGSDNQDEWFLAWMESRMSANHAWCLADIDVMLQWWREAEDRIYQNRLPPAQNPGPHFPVQSNMQELFDRDRYVRGGYQYWAVQIRTRQLVYQSLANRNRLPPPQNPGSYVPVQSNIQGLFQSQANRVPPPPPQNPWPHVPVQSNMQGLYQSQANRIPLPPPQNPGPYVPVQSNMQGLYQHQAN